MLKSSMTEPAMPKAEFAAHVHTYQTFLRIVFWFTVHVAVLLILLAYFFV